MKQFALAVCLTFVVVVAQAQETKSVTTPVKQNVSVVKADTPAPATVVQEKKPAVQPTPSGAAAPAQQSGTPAQVVAGSTAGCCCPTVDPCCQPRRGRLLSRIRGRFGRRCCR